MAFCVPVHLTAVLVRFYRSFNFDYERKARSPGPGPDWEQINGHWYPFIRVALEAGVTAVVGANESGKTHLIDVVDKALTGSQIDRRFFCRYSALYSVERGEARVPDFGFEVKLDSTEDGRLAQGLPGDLALNKGRVVTFLRMDGEPLAVLGADGALHPLNKGQVAAATAWLPAPFRLRTDVPLPDNISFDALLDRDQHPLSSRGRRGRFLDGLRKAIVAEDATAARDELVEELLESSREASDDRKQRAEDLARVLMFEIARIDKKSVLELEAAVRKGDEGTTTGLIGQMNRSLARHLNFSTAWRQDRDFKLLVEVRESELSFTISDRTGTGYSFGERSRGLTYFLSYFVQLLGHERPDRPEILLMDEPDAFLSSAGQQDLLRFLEAFALADRTGRTDQVLYVTHSPFLINRNAPQRIRVLDKGTDQEGTRVVHDVARNRYEPLRSAIGAFVAETAFIGGVNLIVEGPADQVLLAGMTTVLRDAGIAPRQLLDLNAVTLVPAGGASSVPYMAYLARGRGEVKPACVALLDGDDAGAQAAKQLRRRTPAGAPVLEDRHIVHLSEWFSTHREELILPNGVKPAEPEDLLPLEVVVEAARAYAVQLLLAKDADPEALNVVDLAANLPTADGRVFKALELTFDAAFDGGHIDKVGFAREVVRIAAALQKDAPKSEAAEALRKNFSEIIAELSMRLASASSAETERRSTDRITRLLETFAKDHPVEMMQDEAERFLEELLVGLEDTPVDDRVRRDVENLRREFRLGDEPLALVVPFDEFARRVSDLRYAERLSHQELPPSAAVAAAQANRPRKRSTQKARRVSASGNQDRTV